VKLRRLEVVANAALAAVIVCFKAGMIETVLPACTYTRLTKNGVDRAAA
jgi:hypothetical protein